MSGPRLPEWLRKPRSRIANVSLAFAAIGTWLRLDYALGHHHLRHHASSDAFAYLERAQELIQLGARPNLPATIWPPGTSALWALLSAFDPSQALSAFWNACASIAVMPLTAAIAGLLAGPRAAWIALAIAALHPGFIHYSGYALAEQPFQLAVAVALYLTLSALARFELTPSAAPASSTSRAGSPTAVTRRSTAVGQLGPPSPGGGSAEGRWFGRFSESAAARASDPARAARSATPAAQPEPDNAPGPAVQPVPAAHGVSDALADSLSPWFAGAAAGCAWALAALFRPNAIPVLAVGALALALRSRALLPKRALGFAIGLGLAVVLTFVAAAERCTETAGGRFCVISNNLAMSLALGQAGPVIGLEFNDPAHPELGSAWVPPGLIEHDYQGMGRVPASVYDTGGVLHWAARRFAEDPIAFCVRAVGNAFDMFDWSYWPYEFGRYSERAAFVMLQIWATLVFVPAFFVLPGLLRRALGRKPSRPISVFVAGAILGVVLAPLISIGEPRYRIPFDGLWIALASAAYARVTEWTSLEFTGTPALAARHWLPWMQTLIVGIVLIIGITHPAMNLGLFLPQHAAALVSRKSPVVVKASEYATPHAPGSPWDAPDNYRWHCGPDCPELKLRFEARRRAKQLWVSVDHNDRYRVIFYRGSAAVAHADIAPALQIQSGLQVALLEVPAAARGGIDAIGVQPMYGDRMYTLGHVQLE